MIRMPIVVAFLLIATIPAFAQDKGVGHILYPPKIKRANSSLKRVEGKIAEINEGKVVIENDHGAKKEFKINTKTKYQLSEKKRVKLTEVKPGTFVSITFDETNLTAQKVQETTKKFKE